MFRNGEKRRAAAATRLAQAPEKQLLGAAARRPANPIQHLANDGGRFGLKRSFER
jgi:hypothetical protein